MNSQPTGLYGWIRSNDGRSLGLFAGFLLAVQAITAMVLFLPLTIIDPAHAPFMDWGGYCIRYVPLVVTASVIWFGWQMFWHIETVKRAVGFRFIDDSEEPRLCRLIEPLITMMGLPIPFVGVIDDPARNAFACGIGRKKAVIVVTRGLIDDLDDEELACVLGHELSHIKHGDIRLMAAANIFMNALTRLHKNNPLKFTPVHVVLAIAIPAVLPLTLAGGFIGHLALRAGQVSRLIIASAREYIADAEAVQLTKNPAAMASALVKVEHRYQVAGARREDDAMMIAGDTEGENATHPTVAQRIAALARTTGSMVFNAPGALPEAVWDNSKTLSEARAAALLRQLPKADVLPRLRVGSGENLLGLTRSGMAMAAVTVLALIFIHWSEVGNPRTLAAKFDVRPIALMLGSPLPCEIASQQDCKTVRRNGVYREFEGQQNTLAGWLADSSRARREAGVVNADVSLGTFGAPTVRRELYSGQSLKMKGVYREATADGFYNVGSGGMTNVEPQALVIAEIDQIGCWPGTMFYGDVEGHYPFGKLSGGEDWLGKYQAYAANSLISSGHQGEPEYDEWLRQYAETRELMIHASFDHWGTAGLTAMREAYGGDDHAQMVKRIRDRLADPVFTKGVDPVDAAKLRSLARDPELFVPCIVHRRGVM